MKAYLILAVVFTVAQATTLTNIPVRNYRQSQFQPGQLGYSGPRVAIAGPRDVTESIHQESGNLYAGQRDGRFLTRDSTEGNYGEIQYSIRPEQRDFRGQFPNQYQQQQGIRRFQDSSAYYGSPRNPQISYSAPLANTRSYNPRLDATGNPQNEYRFY
ncbi:uncharacterized protein LOC129966331 [Argiope bruennichi]|uniref:Hymenoptaecin n=1 Tax=Argiope bruennichi TaxID=94029 RepID=A0A8T0E6B2_ARGBR|nr:uncharacterized protein LOC129966331 [Argiope bruennichi]KAF8767333.1 hypothetical protein HNY73_020313 [Argiope bruennichi]